MRPSITSVHLKVADKS